jgi:beta-glucosidase
MPDSTWFPDNFLWGASTASHQVEGGNIHNDWWQAEHSGTVPHSSGAACDQFNRYASDFRMAADQGHNAHRLSIEWSRIEPKQGEWDLAALEHYVAVIASLRSSGLEPIVTLHHFTNPAWFASRGGWECSDAPELFLRYVEQVMTRLGASVRWWLTINEPTVFVKRAYFAGSWPPHRTGSPWRGWRALRSLLAAHNGAYQLIHRHRADARVGFAHSAPWVEPHDPARALDRMVAAVRGYVLNHLCLRLMRGFGELPLDFIGINYYSRELVRWQFRGLSWLFGAEPPLRRDGVRRRFSTLGWEIHPEGLHGVLSEFSRYRLPLLVTENGIATTDESLRCEYLETHLRSLASALAAGVDVRGYCYWSLLDNFEWAEGFNARFGLAAVDFTTQVRTLRPAALRYAEICRSNGKLLHAPVR